MIDTLIDDLKKATVGNRSLDLRLAAAFGWTDEAIKYCTDDIPHYSTNLADITDELADRGFGWTVHSHGDGVIMRYGDNFGTWYSQETEYDTFFNKVSLITEPPALSLCIAFLRSLK
jgi:hypothetical protein